MRNSGADRKNWIGLAVLACPCLLLSMDFTILHLAVPAITAQLHPSSAQLLWIVDIYGFTIAASLITMGTLGDRIGRRRLLLWGAAIFGVASVAAAFSQTATMLIVTRGLLGVAGSTLMPSTLALIRNMFHDDHERRIAISIWINAYVIGGIIGPIAGGFVLARFWWGAAFLLNVPVMVALLAVGPRLLPEFKDPNAGRMDIPSAALSLIALLSITYGIKQFAQQGSAVIAAASIVAGLIVGWLFVLRQRGLKDPLIDLELFGVPAFSASIGMQLAAAMTTSGIYLFMVQYLQLVLGLSPLHAGYTLVPSTIAALVGTTLAPRLANRMGAGRVVGAGMSVCALGMILLTQVGMGPGVMIVVVSYVIVSFGVSMAMTLTTDLIIGVAPPERAGSASAISETSGELGLALGVALLGSVGTAVYRHGVSSSLPIALPPDAIESAKATLGGAMKVATTIGNQAGADLAMAARVSFTQALQVVAGVAAVVVILTTATTVLLLRRPSVDEDHRPDDKQGMSDELNPVLE